MVVTTGAGVGATGGISDWELVFDGAEEVWLLTGVGVTTGWVSGVGEAGAGEVLSSMLLCFQVYWVGE